MFRFANPEYLYLLLVAVVLAAVFILTSVLARRRVKRFGDWQVLKNLVPGYSGKRPVVKFVLMELALVSLTFMFARPQYGWQVDKEKSKGIEVVISLDVSNSMLAEDIRPNRLERSKLLVSNLIDRMQNDKVALQVFAGEAYPQLPITNDYVSAKMFLDAVDVNMITLQGTSLAAAIDLAAASFTENTKVGKAIVVITDGEDHEAGAIEAAAQAAKKDMHVYVLGIGSPQGAEIPTPEGPFTDESGNVVHTALNEDMCRQVAQAGGGAYIHIDNTNNAQEELQSHLAQLEHAEETISYKNYNEQFRSLAVLSLVLLFFEFFMSETKNPLLGKIKLFKR